VQIRIDGSDLPGRSCGPSPDSPGGYQNIEVAVQRRGQPAGLLGRTAADAPAASWTIDCELVRTTAGLDLKGRYVQGPPGGRFIYLCWGAVDGAGAFTMFRRAKLWLDAIPPDVLDEADRKGTLVGRLGLTDDKGGPLCASVRPPIIEWSAPGA
jgi:hypothetical protein